MHLHQIWNITKVISGQNLLFNKIQEGTLAKVYNLRVPFLVIILTIMIIINQFVSQHRLLKLIS